MSKVVSGILMLASLYGCGESKTAATNAGSKPTGASIPTQAPPAPVSPVAPDPVATTPATNLKIEEVRSALIKLFESRNDPALNALLPSLRNAEPTALSETRYRIGVVEFDVKEKSFYAAMISADLFWDLKGVFKANGGAWEAQVTSERRGHAAP